MSKLKKTNEQRSSRLVTDSMVTMSIDDSAMNLIIERLIDMYSNKAHSVVRELVSNALDATKLNKGAVEISVPTASDMNFYVKDFGTGMSKDDIINIYTKYGASTKRADMSQIGAYGLGAKVPLAYTDSFTVETVKDGKRILGQVLREGGITTFEILQETDTKQSNGTKVELTVVNEYDLNSFREAIEYYKTYNDLLENRISFI